MTEWIWILLRNLLKWTLGWRGIIEIISKIVHSLIGTILGGDKDQGKHYYHNESNYRSDNLSLILIGDITVGSLSERAFLLDEIPDRFRMWLFGHSCAVTCSEVAWSNCRLARRNSASVSVPASFRCCSFSSSSVKPVVESPPLIMLCMHMLYSIIVAFQRLRKSCQTGIPISNFISYLIQKFRIEQTLLD